MLNNLIAELEKARNPEQAEILQRFFKTGKGEYGDGDVFLGIKVPVQRSIAKKYFGLGLPKIKELLKSKVHEHRLTGVIILDGKYKKAGDGEKENIFNFYLENIKNINNWDLVDLSAPHIVGNYLLTHSRQILYKLAKSKNLWERRIGILACFAFIRQGEFDDALKISEILLNDEHDLIHKAVGWMLREVWKRNEAAAEKFLREHYKKMPRTMLRYAIERMDEEKRRFYLGK